MSTPLVAFGIGATSLYGIYSSIKDYQKINLQKNELAKNIIDYKDISILQPNTKRLVSTHISTDSGILELYKMKYKTEINYLNMNDTKVLVVNPNVATKKHVFTQILKADFGLTNFEPNFNRKCYLLDKNISEKCESNGNSIVSFLTSKYGLEKMWLNPSHKYLSVFYPLKNKTIYMYGQKNNSDIFTPILIGTNKEEIIDEVYISEDFNNLEKMFISICGLTFAFVLSVAK